MKHDCVQAGNLNPESPIPAPCKHGADPKDTARRLLLARQRLHERASCSGEKPLLAARGAHQDVYGYINSRMASPAPGQKKSVTHVEVTYET